MPFPAGDNNPAHVGSRVKPVNPAYPPTRSGQSHMRSSTRLNQSGEGISGLNGMVTLVEEGVINFKLLVKSDGGGLRVGSFSEYAMFLDKFDPYNPEGPFIYQGLGRATGLLGASTPISVLDFGALQAVRTPQVFRGHVSQSYQSASFYRYGAGEPPAPVDAGFRGNRRCVGCSEIPRGI